MPDYPAAPPAIVYDPVTNLPVPLSIYQTAALAGQAPPPLPPAALPPLPGPSSGGGNNGIPQYPYDQASIQFQYDQLHAKNEYDKKYLAYLNAQLASTAGNAAMQAAVQKQISETSERIAAADRQLNQQRLALDTEIQRGTLALNQRQFAHTEAMDTANLQANPRNLAQSLLMMGASSGDISALASRFPGAPGLGGPDTIYGGANYPGGLGARTGFTGGTGNTAPVINPQTRPDLYGSDGGFYPNGAPTTPRPDPYGDQPWQWVGGDWQVGGPEGSVIRYNNGFPTRDTRGLYGQSGFTGPFTQAGGGVHLTGPGSPGFSPSDHAASPDAVPSYDSGTPYVPEDQLALVHQGEQITPAAQNPFNPEANMNLQPLETPTFMGPVASANTPVLDFRTPTPNPFTMQNGWLTAGPGIPQNAIPRNPGFPFIAGRHLDPRLGMSWLRTNSPMVGLTASLASLSGQDPNAFFGEFNDFLPKGGAVGLTRFR